MHCLSKNTNDFFKIKLSLDSIYIIHWFRTRYSVVMVITIKMYSSIFRSHIQIVIHFVVFFIIVHSTLVQVFNFFWMQRFDACALKSNWLDILKCSTNMVAWEQSQNWIWTLSRSEKKIYRSRISSRIKVKICCLRQVIMTCDNGDYLIFSILKCDIANVYSVICVICVYWILNDY